MHRRFRHFATLLLVLAMVGCSIPAFAGDWLVISTEHFNILYQPKDGDLAAKAAAVAEQVHPLVVTRLNHAPETKTTIIIQEEAASFNGWATVIPHNTIQISPVAPGDISFFHSGISLRVADWLTILITHEYTHIVHGDMAGGIYQVVKEIFGYVPGVVNPNFIGTSFMLEGVAQWNETALTEGGRGHSPMYDMYLRTAVLAGKLPPLDQVLESYPLNRYNPTGGAYLYGYSFIDFLATKYGDEKLQQLLHKTASRSGYLSSVFPKVYGLGLAEAWADWQETTVQTYSRQAQLLHSKGLTSLEEMASKGDIVLHASFSPQGNFVAYAGIGTIYPSLRIISSDGATDTPVLEKDVSSSASLSWYPNGRKLVYARENGDTEAGFTDLYTYDLDSRREKRLTTGMHAYAPAVSADGSRLLFFTRPGPTQSKMKLKNLVTGETTDGQLPFPKDMVFLSAAWAPDGHRLAIAAWQPGGYSDIYVADLDAGTITPITLDRAVDQHPTWSPDGRYVLYDSDLTGVFNIYSYDTRDNKHAQVTNVATGVFAPTVSPTEQELVVTEYTAEGYTLAKMGFAPTDWFPVTRSREAVRRPPVPTLETSLLPHPYSPFPSLQPNYWWPVFGIDEKGPQIGAQTSGADLLQNTLYSVRAGLGLGSRRPFYDLTFQQKLGEGGNWLATFSAMDASERIALESSNLWLRNQQSIYALSWNRTTAQSSTSVAAFYSPSKLSALGTTDTLNQAWAGAEFMYNRSSGRNEWWHSRQGTGIFTTVLGEKDTATFTYYQRETWSTQKRTAVLNLGIGLTEAEENLVYGGSSSDFPVRGAEPAYAGEQTYQISGGFLWRYAIERGWLDTPVFWDEVKQGPFLDAAWSKSGGENQQKASIGWQVEAPFLLDYGRSSLALKFGIAKELTNTKGLSFYFGGTL